MTLPGQECELFKTPNSQLLPKSVFGSDGLLWLVITFPGRELTVSVSFGRNDRVSGHDQGDTFADLFDNAAAFMAENAGKSLWRLRQKE